MEETEPIVNFNIRTFLDYYNDRTNPNVFKDPKPPKTLFYDKNNNVRRKRLKPEYIIINGEKLYITYYIDDEDVEHMLFTIPTYINKKLWDIHYHFGVDKKIKSLRKTRKSNKPLEAVFFHKTIQIPDENKKYFIRCYFENGIEINDIKDIKCVSDRTNRMRDEFPITSDDFMYLQEIIRRPFYGVSVSGGVRRIMKKYNKKRVTRRKRRSYLF